MYVPSLAIERRATERVHSPRHQGVSEGLITCSCGVCGVLQMGVDEIDMVVNVGKLKDQAFNYVLADIKAVVEATARFLLLRALSFVQCACLCSHVAVCWRQV
jgi:hypothetical protein